MLGLNVSIMGLKGRAGGGDGGGGTPALWTPLDLGADIVRFYHAADASGYGLGGEVLVWHDRAGVDDAGAPLSSGAPTYEMGVDGVPYLEFTGASDIISTPSGLPSGADPCTMFVVGTPRGSLNSTTNAAVWYGSTTSGNMRLMGVRPSGSAVVTNVSPYYDYAKPANGTDWLDHRAMLYGEFAPTYFAGRFNGGALEAYSRALDTAAGSDMRIGGRDSGTAWDGGISCVIVVARLLTDEDRQKLEGWAAWEFGLVAELPADHPHKNYAPEQPVETPEPAADWVAEPGDGTVTFTSYPEDDDAPWTATSGDGTVTFTSYPEF